MLRSLVGSEMCIRDRNYRVFWNISSILYRVRVQLDAAPIMLISGKSINDNDVAAASHRISRLLHPSRTLVTISCSTINGALRGNAPRPHTHLTSAQVSKPRGVWTKTQTNCQCGQALLGTRERRGKHGDSRSQDTQGGKDYTSATTGIRHIGRSDSNNDSRSAQGVRNAPMQPTVLVFPPGTSCEGVNSRTMRARRQPDGREAWLQLERMNGGRAQDERPVQQRALGRRLRDLQCNSAEESEDFMVKLDTIWGAFEAFGNAKAEEAKRVALPLGIKEALPQVFIQLTTQPGITYDELKRAVVASTYLTSDMDRRDEAVAFQSRTDCTKAGTGLDSNQFAYCLKRNHRGRECRSYLNGKPPAERPPGMSPSRIPTSSIKRQA